MSVGAPPLFENTFVRDLEGLYERWNAESAPDPSIVVLNDALATELRLDPAHLHSDDGVALLLADPAPEGAEPVAQAYAGHQFGGWSPRLGDGRALLLGELITEHGARVDVHLKGSGRTPFARGGDGKAALGPMLREYLMCEAMHSLGVRTTRGLAVVSTGESVFRERPLPGAVFVRVASSHLRVGTFQYAAARGDRSLLARLADHAIERHHPEVAGSATRHLDFLDAVARSQADLIAAWMSIGFVHGVMNTDNMTISGETIDYGPCAFLDAYDPATVFSSIDHGGRYAFGNQPQIAQWNLARLAEALLPLIDDDTDRAVGSATEVLERFPEMHRSRWLGLMRAKLGIAVPNDDDERLVLDLLELMRRNSADFTNTFRALADLARGDAEQATALLDRVDTSEVTFDEWVDRWSSRRTTTPEEMDAINPLYIPRNHVVEGVLDAATDGDPAPFFELLDVVAHPFTARPGLEAFAVPAPDDYGPHRTFCGT